MKSKSSSRVAPFGAFLVGMEFRVARTQLWPMAMMPVNIGVGVVVCMFLQSLSM